MWEHLNSWDLVQLRVWESEVRWGEGSVTIYNDCGSAGQHSLLVASIKYILAPGRQKLCQGGWGW